MKKNPEIMLLIPLATVDGRNPAAVDMENIQFFHGVPKIIGGAGFLPSTVL